MLDPPLAAHFEAEGCSHCFFCFRWLLLLLKREFDYGGGGSSDQEEGEVPGPASAPAPEPLLVLWDHLFARPGDVPYQLLYACGILIRHRGVILQCRLAFDEMLGWCNRVSGRLNVSRVIKDAEALEVLAGEVGREILEGVAFKLKRIEVDAGDDQPN